MPASFGIAEGACSRPTRPCGTPEARQRIHGGLRTSLLVMLYRIEAREPSAPEMAVNAERTAVAPLQRAARALSKAASANSSSI